jgi:hypothetical protein
MTTQPTAMVALGKGNYLFLLDFTIHLSFYDMHTLLSILWLYRKLVH